MSNRVVANWPIATGVNVVAVITGSLIGLLVQNALPDGFENIMMQAVGLGTILIAIKMMLKLPDGYLLPLMFALILGGILGELLSIDQVLNGLSDQLKNSINVEDSSFTEGLITAFLLFCIGSMTIVGAIEEGLNNKRELILVKSLMDGFTSIALAASYGIGVIFSVIPLLIFQGGLTLLAKRLKPVFDQKSIDTLSAVGGVLIVGISINILGLGHVNLENLLPALVFAIILSKLNQRMK